MIDPEAINRPLTDASMTMPASVLAPGLYVIGVPIGCMEDLSFRAVRILGQLTRLLVEDTRKTGALLKHYGLHVSMVPHHNYTEHRLVSRVVEWIRSGESVGLVSDAGMPAIADPGYWLIQSLYREACPVHVIPGPSALTSALALSGLPTAPAQFLGFLPARGRERERALEQLWYYEGTSVWFESPRRLCASLEDLRARGDHREMVVLREMTKMHGSRVSGSVALVCEHYQKEEPRGEIVCLLAGYEGGARGTQGWEEALQQRLLQGSLRDAVESVSEAYGVPRRMVYKAALALQYQVPD
jgi:16S rRNA (cytidine1402-2'-O)-methyltransferase